MRTRGRSKTATAAAQSGAQMASADAASPTAGNAQRAAMTLVAASLGYAVVQLDVSVVNVAVKSIGASLGADVNGLQWVVAAYTVTFAAFILSAGALTDRIGARRVFVAGFVLFTSASVLCGLSTSLEVLIAARAIQGVGAAVLVPASLSLLDHSHPDPDRRARAVGLYLAVAALSLSGGPLIGGLLISLLGWRAIFFINVPVAAAGVFITLRWASETTRLRQRGLDLPGQLTAVVTLVALVGSTIEGGRRGFANPLILGGYAVAALGAVLFVRIEARSQDPMLPLGLFRAPAFSVSTLIGLLSNTCFYGLLFVLSLLFQREQHLSPLQTGLALLPMTLAITSANLLAKRLCHLVGQRWTVAAGALAIGCATGGLIGVDAATPYWGIVVQTVLLGFGTGLVIAVATDATLGSVDTSQSGIAGGTLNTARQTGSALGVALFGSLIAARFITGLHVALAVSVGMMVAVILASRLLVDQPPAPGAATRAP